MLLHKSLTFGKPTSRVILATPLVACVGTPLRNSLQSIEGSVPASPLLRDFAPLNAAGDIAPYVFPNINNSCNSVLDARSGFGVGWISRLEPATLNRERIPSR
jgi:hypothetical protein